MFHLFWDADSGSEYQCSKCKDQPAFVEVIEKALYVGVQHVVHLPLQERVRQRIQRIVLAAPRTENIRKARKSSSYLVEDGDHSLLDDLIIQCRDSQGALPSIGLLYVHSS
jgi:hypothetical protein